MKCNGKHPTPSGRRNRLWRTWETLGVIGGLAQLATAVGVDFHATCTKTQPQAFANGKTLTPSMSRNHTKPVRHLPFEFFIFPRIHSLKQALCVARGTNSGHERIHAEMYGCQRLILPRTGFGFGEWQEFTCRVTLPYL